MEFYVIVCIREIDEAAVLTVSEKFAAFRPEVL